MKVIKQEKSLKIETDVYQSGERYLYQDGNLIEIDKQGAAELIKIFQEWVKDENH